MWVGVSINTVTKLLEDAGEASYRLHHEPVQDVPAMRVQCDEIWSFCYAKPAIPAPEEAGDVWTWTGIDADSKLIINWLVSPGRDGGYALEFMDGLRNRLANRVQLTTNGHGAYLAAVEGAFGGDVDYARLIKIYGPVLEEGRRYSLADCVGVKVEPVVGLPERECISNSYIEMHNFTTRMSMRRFTLLTNAFSKKLANHGYALALYFAWYNFIRPH